MLMHFVCNRSITGVNDSIVKREERGENFEPKNAKEITSSRENGNGLFLLPPSLSAA